MGKSKRKIVIPIFGAILVLVAFSRTVGAENIQVVQMLALIVAGFDRGVASVNCISKNWIERQKKM